MKAQILAAIALLLMGAAVLAQAPSAGKGGAKLPSAFQGFSRDADDPVSIEADSLEIHDKERYAVFIGNVVVKQGDSVMRSRELKVYYEGTIRPATDGKKAAPASASSGKARNDPAQRIRRIEALGGIIVTNKEQKATGDKGIFDMPTNTATVSGNVVVSQGPNVMRGDRLVVDLKTGVAKLESSGKSGGGRVQGLFLPSSIDKKSQQK